MKSILIKITNVIACLLLCGLTAWSQELNNTDSVKVYHKIETFSGKRHFTRLLYPVFFKSPPSGLQPKTGLQNDISDRIKECENKVLRSISIQVFDPFTFQVQDSLAESKAWIARAGNILHVRTLPIAVRNLLLIRRNDVFDSLMVKESVRLIRKQSYVRDVHLSATIDKDSVDLVLYVQDVWSIVPDGSLSANTLKLSLKEQNFLGTGQQLKAEQNSNLNNGNSWYQLNYSVPNIDNTFINAQIGYREEENGGLAKSIHINRPFYSTFTRWAGGVELDEFSKRDSIHPGPDVYIPHYRYTVQDYWLGTAWPVFRGNTELERSTNLMLTGRFNKVNYLGIPAETIDTAGLVTDEILYLFGIGLNSRKYIQESYLFRYGVTEDIPIGRTYMMMGGIREKQGNSSFYFGLKGQWADYYQFGYLGFKAEWGTYLANGYKREASGLFGFSYFTTLKKLGGWKFRQFVKGELAFGSNLLPSVKLAFDPYMGASGFDAVYNMIRTKGIISLQTQAYAPWNFLGFRFGPYLQGSLGFLSTKEFNISQSKVFAHFGLGVLIRNDFLNASFLQLSISYYPVIPSTGNHVFRTNTFTTRDFGLMDFDSGKPEIISLQ